MLNLPLDGYRATKLLRSSSTAEVYAAVRIRDERPVVVKLFELAHDASREARVEHEFSLIHGLEVEGVARALALERAGTHVAVVLDWCAGINLAEFAVGRPIALDVFFEVALQLARILSGVHEARVIHRDIKPTNIIIDPESHEVWLADFGISVLLETERERIHDVEVLEGTLPYVSPEQTGRTQREVDFRSDLYSLGVTFYELLTGRRPFEGRAPLELIHAHLARRPESPQWLRAEIPTALAAIVMKLLEKAPERRYQSARGLRLDLDRLFTLLEAGAGVEEFELGRDDVSMTLQLPHRLYGRSVEVELLVREYRQAGEGESRFALISGPAGMGKTALLAEIAEPVLALRGFLARGQFRREDRDKPFFGVIAAFTDIVEQLLTESDERLDHWRERIGAQLGPLLPVLCELVPRLRPLFDAVGLVHHLGPAEAHNRAALACTRFIEVFARADHPLALALDDLHWADRASCELLASVLTQPGNALLLLGTMRMDEVSPSHAIREVIEACDAERDRMLWLDIGPLGRGEIAALVGDALARPPDEVAPLAALVGRKANQNPFFVRQFLTNLAELGLLRPTAEGWTWSEREIELAGIPDDLVEMMSGKIERLDGVARGLLTIAAVIGARFEFDVLELVAEPKSLGRSLIRLVDQGLLTVLGDRRYAFAHERIRELAYSMVEPGRRAEIHREVVDHTLAHVDVSGLGDGVFELVDHIDRGYGLVPLLDEPPERAHERAQTLIPALDELDREHFAELNALAGHRALNGASARAAVGYFEAGVRLLEFEGDWPGPGEGGYMLRLALELGLCQALALAGEGERADRHYRALLARPIQALDYGRLVSKRIESLVLLGEREAAVAAGLEGLRSLGLEPAADGQAALEQLLPQLEPERLRALMTRARASADEVRAAMGILSMIVTSARRVDSELSTAVIVMHVELILREGIDSSTPMALSQLGLLVGTGMGRIDQGLELIALAREFAAREGPSCPRHRIAPLECLLRSWRYPYASNIAELRVAISEAMEAGDIEFARMSNLMLLSVTFAAGTHLRGVERAAELAAYRMRQWSAGSMAPIADAHLDFARLLLSGDDELLGAPDPLGLEAIPDDLGHRPVRVGVLQLQLRLLVIAGRTAAAWALVRAYRAQPSDPFAAAWQLGSLLELEGVVAAAMLGDPETAAADRAEAEAALARNAATARAHADDGVVGFAPVASLLEAELCASQGQQLRAFEGLSQARREAAERGALATETQILERMAAHARALPELALGPLREARDRYRYWGAFAKVEALEREWAVLATGSPPTSGATGGAMAGAHNRGAGSDSRRSVTVSGEIAGRTGARSTQADDPTSTRSAKTASGSHSTSLRSLDMSTVIEAAQAIASEVRLDEVVGRVMELALENAGADRGVLVLERDGEFGIAAICSAEHPLRSFLRKPIPLGNAGNRAPLSLFHYVQRTREPAIFEDIRADLRFANDPYIDHQRPRSVLCIPIVKQDVDIGLLYLENKLSPGSFTRGRVEILNMLVAQAASALDNAKLYERLRASELRWRSLVAGLPDVVLLVDRSGKIEFVNHTNGVRDVNEMIGELAGAYVDPSQLDLLRAAMREVVKTAELVALELRGTFVSEAPRWYRARLAPIVVDGRVQRIIAVGTDVTELVRAEAKQAELEATVRQQQRLESIGTLASGVAHEINNPVQGIMNYAELISTSPDATPMIREFSEEIRHESDRVATIVRNLLAFSRQEGDRAAAAANLGGIVDGTLSLIRTVLRKDQINLIVEIPDGLPTVDCRVQQIQQVLMNLVANSRDALRERWPEEGGDKRIEIRGSSYTGATGLWVRLSVIDNGGGIDEQALPSIFDPFFTTKGRDQGTGLGLSVSHGIIAEHGGELRIDNRVGDGASFHIDLPANEERGEFPPLRVV